MKLNERSVAHYATCDSPPDKTGFLFKKGERHTAYHRRWCVLKGNMLFYFEERDGREPLGVVVLEGCTVELCESAEEFAFAVKFADCAKARVYKMAAENQAAMESWVKALSRASFDYMRLVVRELERQLEEIQEAAAGGRPKASKRNTTAVARSRSGASSSSSSTSSSSSLSLSSYNNGPLPAAPSPAAQGGAYASRSPQDEAQLVSKESGGAAWRLNGEGSSSSSCVPWEGSGGGGSGGGARPPPVPPRRRGASLESPFSPGTVCFSKLHDWYGQEVEELRAEWLQDQ